MDTDVRTGTVRLLSLNPLNVYHKFLTINLYHFANLLALVVTPYNLKNENNTNFIINYTNILYNKYSLVNFGVRRNNQSHILNHGVASPPLPGRSEENLPSTPFSSSKQLQSVNGLSSSCYFAQS